MVQIIDVADARGPTCREAFWIEKLKYYLPLGLNVFNLQCISRGVFSLLCACYVVKYYVRLAWHTSDCVLRTGNGGHTASIVCPVATCIAPVAFLNLVRTTRPAAISTLNSGVAVWLDITNALQTFWWNSFKMQKIIFNHVYSMWIEFAKSLFTAVCNC